MAKPFVRPLVPAYISESESLLRTESLRRALETLRWQSRSRTAGTFCHDGTELTYSLPQHKDAWSHTQIDQWLDKRLEGRAFDDTNMKLSAGAITTEPSVEVRTTERWVDEKKEAQFHPPARLLGEPPSSRRLYPGGPAPSQQLCRRAVTTAHDKGVLPSTPVHTNTAPQCRPLKASPYISSVQRKAISSTARRRTPAKGTEHSAKVRTRKVTSVERYQKGTIGDTMARSKGWTATNSGDMVKNEKCHAGKDSRRLGMAVLLKEADAKKSLHPQSKVRRAAASTAPSRDEAPRYRTASRAPAPKASAVHPRKAEQKPQKRAATKTKQVHVSIPSCNYQPAVSSNRGASHRVQKPQPAPTKAHAAPPRRKVKKRIAPTEPKPASPDAVGFLADVGTNLNQSQNPCEDFLSPVLPDMSIEDSMLENYFDNDVAYEHPAKQEVLRNNVAAGDFDRAHTPHGLDDTIPTNVSRSDAHIAPCISVPTTKDLPHSTPSRNSAREEFCTLDGSRDARDGIPRDDGSLGVARSAERSGMPEHVPNVEDARLVDAYIERAWAEVGGYSIAREVDVVGRTSITGLNTSGYISKDVETAHPSGGDAHCTLPFAQAASSPVSVRGPPRLDSSSRSCSGVENELPYTTDKMACHGRAHKSAISPVSRLDTEPSYNTACIDSRLLESCDDESPSRKDQRSDTRLEVRDEESPYRKDGRSDARFELPDEQSPPRKDQRSDTRLESRDEESPYRKDGRSDARFEPPDEQSPPRKDQRSDKRLESRDEESPYCKDGRSDACLKSVDAQSTYRSDRRTDIRLKSRDEQLPSRTQCRNDTRLESGDEEKSVRNDRRADVSLESFFEEAPSLKDRSEHARAESCDGKSPSPKDRRADAVAEDKAQNFTLRAPYGTRDHARVEDCCAAAGVDGVALEREGSDEGGRKRLGAARDVDNSATEASSEQRDRLLELVRDWGRDKEKARRDEPTFGETLSQSASDMSPTAAIRKYGLATDVEAVCATENASASSFSAPRPVASCLQEIDLALAELLHELEKEEFI